jgi:acetyl esterase/lipase
MCLYDLFIDTPLMTQFTNITMDIEKLHEGNLIIDEKYDFTKCDSKIVEQFPKTYIICASKDIIRDECYKLADFLLSHNVPTELKEFLYYSHGFLAISTLDKYYEPGVQQVVNYARSIFS